MSDTYREMPFVIEIRDIHVRFVTDRSILHTVQGVTMEVPKGSIVALAGESGCGKTVTMKAALGLLGEDAEVESAEVLLNGRDISDMPDSSMQEIRGREVSYVFQEPAEFFDPLFSIRSQMKEALKVHGLKADKDILINALKEVGIAAPEEVLGSYPHQMSGGMLQRIAIAMGLITEPVLIIADEPTTSLDVTVQAQVIDLMMEINRKNGTSFLIISHDLALLAGCADTIYIMYAGRIVEHGKRDDLFKKPFHPYTYGLIHALPEFCENGRLEAIPGTVPDCTSLPDGCTFAPRCPLADEGCRKVEPCLEKTARGGAVRCYKAGKLI